MLAAGEQLSSECLYSVSCVVHVLRFWEESTHNEMMFFAVGVMLMCHFFVYVFFFYRRSFAVSKSGEHERVGLLFCCKVFFKRQNRLSTLT